MFLKKTFQASVICLFAYVGAVSQTRLDSVQALKEVLVTGDRYREVIPSQRLSGERLDALSSFSVADAVRYFSGVQIKDYGGVGGLKTVDIRSMGTNHLGVFYDGVEIGNAQNGAVDLGKFSLDNIEEISLYNGQKSEIFQSAKDFGSAGTVYLRTRRPQFPDGRTTNVVSRIRAGSFDLVNPSVLWEQKIGGGISSSFNVEYIYSSGKYPFRYRKILSGGQTAWDTTAIRQNGDIRSLRLEGGMNGATFGGNWRIKAYFYGSEKGLPGAVVNNVWKNAQRQWDKNAFVQGSFQKPLSDRHDFMVNAKYSNDFMRYLNPDTTLMYIDNTFRQQEIYVSAVNKYAVLPAWDVCLSVDYQWNTLDADLQDFVYPERRTALAALATAVEYGRWKGQASLLGTFVFEKVTRVWYAVPEELLPGVETGTPDDKQEFTPAVFVSYRPAGNFNVRAFYKRIFRMPTFNDLYYTDIGNTALKPEYTVQYNLGFQYDKTFNRAAITYLNVRADAYYNEVIDKIVATPKGGSGGGSLYRWTMKNLGYVEIRGVDVTAQTGWKLPQGALQTSLSYTFQKAQNFTPPADDTDREFYGGQIDYIPRHSGSAIINAAWKTWDANYGFIYVGERYHVSANIPANYERPWYTHDMSVGKTWNYKNSRCKLTAEINNIFNQQFEVITCYPMPGRNYKLVLKVEV
jgi:outer membrane cobalamin receptor